MNNKITTFIIGIYIAVSVSVSGYFYINPTKIYANDAGEWKMKFGRDRLLETDYSYFKYSVLIALVVGILLFTFSQLFKSNKKVNK